MIVSCGYQKTIGNHSTGATLHFLRRLGPRSLACVYYQCNCLVSLQSPGCIPYKLADTLLSPPISSPSSASLSYLTIKFFLLRPTCFHPLHISRIPPPQVTNDIFTQEDGEFLVRNGALPAERIRAVETGGCPHAAIREDISINLGPLEDLTAKFHADILLCESGGGEGLR